MKHFQLRILFAVFAVLVLLPILFITPNVTAADVKINAEFMDEPLTSGSLAGDAGSGWKSDVPVANSADTEIHPSMGTYIDPGSGDVTLYAAILKLHPNTTWGARYEGYLARSFDQGSSWSLWWTWAWMGPYTITYVSLVVNAYNETVFVAFESYPIAGGNHRIDCIRITPAGAWESHPVVTVGDNRLPSLTIEYSYAINYMFVSYEKWTNTDDRDLYVGRSANWGLTWSSQLLRGGVNDNDVYAFSDAAYAQGNVYIAYRHSVDWYSPGHIDVSYSIDYGGSWSYVENVSQVSYDASFPTIAGARAGAWHQPTSVIVAYDYATTPTNYDVLYTWTKDYGATWTGGNGALNQIAASADVERMPQLAVDGMGTESTNVGGNFHLVYWKGLDAYYTQLQYWDLPVMFGPTPWAYYLGWSTPHGLINDGEGYVPLFAIEISITTYTRVVGGQRIWEPGVAWTDGRNGMQANWDIYYSTPGTDFMISFTPSSQTVVAGKSLSYYLTVRRLSGPTAPAYLSGTHWPWIFLGTNYAIAEYNVSPINPTATSTLTVHTSNLMPVGDWSFNATATIGGYRRIVSIPFTVVAAPKLTLNLSPTVVARGAKLTLSGQLTPSLGSVQTIYIYYRYPHKTGTWKLATTISTNVAGGYGVMATVPFSLSPGQYDLVAFWVNTANGAYATSPIKLVTFT